ncbi:hypothetical protein B0T24DRAFT_712189 [Lasiosphaeria ovina]|uniref:Uncharacterized protein n=1 Tax=Lasiosphaeria ovina TaxID=92902 RepID=A0AAE0JV17_9PEZI|nr:hypothetical protein B0T24DRAFT_712189 [Lasiosphaeria ovina]
MGEAVRSFFIEDDDAADDGVGALVPWEGSFPPRNELVIGGAARIIISRPQEERDSLKRLNRRLSEELNKSTGKLNQATKKHAARRVAGIIIGFAFGLLCLRRPSGGACGGLLATLEEPGTGSISQAGVPAFAYNAANAGRGGIAAQRAAQALESSYGPRAAASASISAIQSGMAQQTNPAQLAQRPRQPPQQQQQQPTPRPKQLGASPSPTPPRPQQHCRPSSMLFFFI